ncbi:hypothetical protein PI124_g17248 [Phytophthora idaei]|nr:hypothetical protein PI126_g18473 [Phytophthora idaei]KAG3237767.1 hypothetical protein PI124_g17248 [Phytophthora idaei]
MLHDRHHFVTQLTNKKTGVVYYGCTSFRVARRIVSGESGRTVNTHTCEVPLPTKVVDEHVYARVRDDHEGEVLNPIPERQGSNIVKNTRAPTGEGALRALDTTEDRFLSETIGAHFFASTLVYR